MDEFTRGRLEEELSKLAGQRVTLEHFKVGSWEELLATLESAAGDPGGLKDLKAAIDLEVSVAEAAKDAPFPCGGALAACGCVKKVLTRAELQPALLAHVRGDWQGCTAAERAANAEACRRARATLSSGGVVPAAGVVVSRHKVGGHVVHLATVFGTGHFCHLDVDTSGGG